MSEFCLSSKIGLKSSGDNIIKVSDVKEFIRQDTEFLDINENLIGFKLSDAVVVAINLMFSNRTKKRAGKELVEDE